MKNLNPNPAPHPHSRRFQVRARPAAWLACAALSLAWALPARAQLAYPPTKTGDTVDTYFGKTYADPYRWLEDTKDKEVIDWFKAQAELTDTVLAKIPGRDALARQWSALDKLKPARYGDFNYENGRVFYKKTLGGENVGKIFYRDGWEGAEKLLFDPGTYKAGVTTTVESINPSYDGRFLILGLSAGGAEWQELRVLDVERGTLLPDRIYPSFGPLSWTLDDKGFLYDYGKVNDIKSEAIQLDRKTSLHVLGADIAADRDVFSDESYPDLGITPKEQPQANIDESYPNYIFGSVSTVQSEMRIFYAPASELNDAKIKWSVLCDTSDNLVRGIEFYGDYAYAITHTDAPNYKLVRTPIAHPDWKHAEVVIPEAKDSLQSLAKSKDFLFAVYSNGVVCRIVKYDLASGKTSEVKVPASGTIDILCPDWKSNRCIVFVTAWTFPTTIYDYDAGSDTFAKSIFNSDVTYPGFENLVSEEIEVPGHDGAMIPLSIIHLKGMPMDGSSSCILEGYGAYGYSYTPYFTVRTSVALHGVVVAYAHVRGGSEKGEAWYKGGYKATKPNTWKDYISCADYLVKMGYTTHQHMGGVGTSAGGILISRAITERPDLLAAAVCNVGDANAMRTEFTANGPANIPEFGTVKDPLEINYLYEMDGVAHVQKGVKYPAVLGVGGWNDRRVAVWAPGKFVAAIQNASTSGRPALMKINYDDGHFTEDKTVTFKNFSGMDAFILWQAGNKDFQPAN